MCFGAWGLGDEQVLPFSNSGLSPNRVYTRAGIESLVGVVTFRQCAGCAV